ncbi:pyridine nucleotide-disulfide oxidoreductase/dicluster-binding protein [Oleidesulfovibrio sp.]|uniref:pyridine nucleotide-disulfide oxidoreductase/dicluster-binding protein n=1 Tax=Oleidesulfovibrio sp. TaxID=2909707 RepID=UPI003A83E375
MDQAELRRWEARCTQEEPPRCRAACPLHLDVKEFCTRMAEGKVEQAWATLCRTLPLPRVLARICDAPCRGACIRSEAGGAIEVGALEHACATYAAKMLRIMPVPPRGKQAAVIGCDLAALTAAWDMSKKGVSVTIYSAQPLTQALEGLFLPIGNAGGLAEHLAAELETLNKLGVQISDVPRLDAELLQRCIDTHGAVFVAPQAYPALMQSQPEPDEITLGTAIHGVFAAAPLPPATPEADGASAIFTAAAGRRAASSIARLHEGASLAAGREREGVYETKLFTSLATVTPQPPVAIPATGYTAEEAGNEAARCLRCECMECVKHCAYLQEYGSYPKQYARRIYNNESIVMGTRQANTMINSCMQCGLCATLCPNDFDMGALCDDARKSMVRRGKMPPSAHDFALRDMEFANSSHCTFASHAPDSDHSSWVFFPGCQLSASDPDSIPRAWNWLRSNLPAAKDAPENSSVGLLLRCCGAPAQWSGRLQLTAETVQALQKDWEALGAPFIVAACPSCVEMLKQHLPQATITTIWEQAAAISQNNPDCLKPADNNGESTVVLHDPCGTRENQPLRKAVRSLLHRCGLTVLEPELTGETTECCGFGGLAANANPQLGKKITQGRAERLGAKGADSAIPSESGTGSNAEAGTISNPLAADAVTYCAMCRDRLASGGKRIAHLLDILLPASSGTTSIAAAPLQGTAKLPFASADTPALAPCCDGAFAAAARIAPTLSARHENRARLREHLMTTLRAQTESAPPPEVALTVHYTPEAARHMEERRILDTDVRKVLLHAVEHSAWITDTSHPQQHRLAMLRPVVVSYWVEFTQDDDGKFTVHNVWSHRMRIRTANGRVPL